MIRKPEDGSRGENGPGTTTAARRSGPSPGEHVSSSRATADFTAVPPSTPERCRLLLRQWRSQLSLTLREASVMAPELAGLDRQLRRLEQHRLRLAVHGRVGVGKSSLLNALLGEERFATDVAHGCTRRQQVQAWALPLSGIAQVELVDRRLEANRRA